MTSRVVIEGNFGTTTVETICLNLVSVDSGLERDIVVNVTTLKGTATGESSPLDGPCKTKHFPKSF